MNAGVDLRDAAWKGPRTDMGGEARPAHFLGERPAYDIGADEVH